MSGFGPNVFRDESTYKLAEAMWEACMLPGSRPRRHWTLRLRNRWLPSSKSKREKSTPPESCAARQPSAAEMGTGGSL